MAHQVVGDKGADITKVVLEMVRTQTVKLLEDKWIVLAIELKIPRNEIENMRGDFLLGSRSLIDVLKDVLLRWRSQYGFEATLGKLCDAIRKFGMHNIANRLLNKFVHDSNEQKFESTSFSPHPTKRPQTRAAKQKVLSRLLQEGRKRDVKTPAILSTVKTTKPDNSKNTGSTLNSVAQVGATNIYYYPFKKRLGRGASCLVYEGYFGNVDLPAAVKELDQKENKIYYTELSVFMTMEKSKIDASNVVRLFEQTEYNGMLYFAMEKAKYDLKYLVKQSPNLDTETMSKISYDMVKGLQFLHQNNILHRDIKPENILIFEENQDFLAKLGDFGVSRMLASLTSTLSKSSGTETWMSPEAITAMLSDEPFRNSRAMDIFSLGMVMYFIFSNGKHPFAQSQQHKCYVVMNIKDPKIKPVKLQQMAHYEQSTNLQNSMMEKEPKSRPSIEQVIGHSMFRGIASPAHSMVSSPILSSDPTASFTPSFNLLQAGSSPPQQSEWKMEDFIVRELRSIMQKGYVPAFGNLQQHPVVQRPVSLMPASCGTSNYFHVADDIFTDLGAGLHMNHPPEYEQILPQVQSNAVGAASFEPNRTSIIGFQELSLPYTQSFNQQSVQGNLRLAGFSAVNPVSSSTGPVRCRASYSGIADFLQNFPGYMRAVQQPHQTSRYIGGQAFPGQSDLYSPQNHPYILTGLPTRATDQRHNALLMALADSLIMEEKNNHL